MSSSLLHPSSKSNPSSIAMKTQFLSLCLFLFFISVISAQEAVLDIEGNPVQVGSKYYIVSAIWGPGGGGLSLSYYPNKECRITVTQESSDLNRGIPASFHPSADSNDGTIYLSDSLNVIFDPNDKCIPSCANSTVWQIDGFDAHTKATLITIEGVEGAPRSRFHIAKGSFTFSYKFVYIPGPLSSDQIGVNHLEVRSALGLRPLVESPTNDNPFNVVFIKYDANAVLRTKAGFIAQ